MSTPVTHIRTVTPHQHLFMQAGEAVDIHGNKHPVLRVVAADFQADTEVRMMFDYRTANLLIDEIDLQMMSMDDLFEHFNEQDETK